MTQQGRMGGADKAVCLSVEIKVTDSVGRTQIYGVDDVMLREPGDTQSITTALTSNADGKNYYKSARAEAIVRLVSPATFGERTQ